MIDCALDSQKKAYTPYSNFKVGACVLTDSGKLYGGCNIENAAYSPGNCAERTAIFKAVSEGEKDFAAIAIVGGPADNNELIICPPCGVCRQVINEFADCEEFDIVLGTNKPEDMRVFKLKELLPLGFGPGDLAK